MHHIIQICNSCCRNIVYLQLYWIEKFFPVYGQDVLLPIVYQQEPLDVHIWFS